MWRYKIRMLREWFCRAHNTIAAIYCNNKINKMIVYGRAYSMSEWKIFKKIWGVES